MKLTGDRNECPTCGEFFNSSYAFDLHRAGEFGTAEQPQARRRCLTVAEMTAKGMSKNHDGFWISSAMSAETKSARFPSSANADSSPA